MGSADTTRLRKQRHGTILYLGVYHPAAIWTAQVDGAQTTGDTTVTVKTVVQVRAPALHFQVLIGTLTDPDYYGEAMWVSYSAPTLTLSPHNCQLPNNAYITVMEEIKPQSVNHTQSATDVVLEDGRVAYTNQNTQYRPLAKCGPPAAGFVDTTTDKVTINFYGSAEAIAPGAALDTWTWNFVDGNPAAAAVQGTSVAPIVVEFTGAADRYWSYYVRDDNGNSHTCYRPVMLYDRYATGAPTDHLPYSDIEILGCTADADAGGASLQIRVWTDADATDFPAGALIVLFAEDWYDGEKISLGGQYVYRENILFSGYVRRGTIHQDANRGYVEFYADGLGILSGNLPGMAFTLTSDATPAGWHELAGMTPRLAAYHLLTEHSTLDHVADVYFDLPSYTKDHIDFMDSSLRDQLNNQCCTCVRGRFGSSFQGMLYLEGNPQLLAPADRPATEILSTTANDLISIDLGPEKYEQDATLIDFSGEKANGDPVFSLAPVYPWTRGGQWTKVDGVRADDQTEGNELAGLYEGQANNPYPEIALAWRGNYRVFDPFPAAPTQLNLTATNNARGLVWTNEPTWTKRVTYNYRNTRLLVSTVQEDDAYGPPGKTGNYPTTPPEVTDGVIPVEPPITWEEPFPPPISNDTWASKVYLLTGDGVYYSADFTGPGGAMPTWTLIDGGLPATPTYLWMQGDPFDPGGHQYLLIGDYAVSGQEVLYSRTVGNWGSLTTTDALAQVLYDQWDADGHTGVEVPIKGSTQELTLWSCATDINADGYIAVVGYSGPYWITGAGGSFLYYYFWSTDDGSTWHALPYPTTGVCPAVPANYTSSVFPGLEIGDYKGTSSVSGGQLIYMPLARPLDLYSYLYTSTDKGLNWALTNLSGTLEMATAAFQTDVYQDVVYVYRSDSAALNNDAYFKRSINRGAAWTDLTPAGLNMDYDPGMSFYRFHCLFNPTGSYSDTIRLVDNSNDLYRSDDAGVTWAKTTHGTLACRKLGISLIHDAPEKIYGVDLDASARPNAYRSIAVSADDGATWESKAGANAGTAPYTNSVPCGANVIFILQVFS